MTKEELKKHDEEWIKHNEALKACKKAWENWPTATEAITRPYKKIREEFDNYLCAVQIEAFCYGYKLGMEAAAISVKKGGVCCE